MSQVIIRDLTHGEIDSLVTIAVAAWQPVFDSFTALLGPELFTRVYPDWKADKEDQIRRSAGAGSEVEFVVAEVEGRIAGFVSYHIHHDGVGEIGNNAVDPRFQNGGIATSLYQEVQRRLSSRGVKLLKVTTGLDQSHAPARRAYEKAGFKRSIPMTTYYKEL